MELKKTREDRILVERAQKGNEAAFEVLMKKYRKSVYYMLLKMVRNPDDAEDLTQEAFAKAFSSIKKFDSTYAFSTWLFRIATNNCIDFIRKKRLQTISIDSPVDGSTDGDGPYIELKSETLDPADEMLRTQRKKYLEMAIERIPEKYQELVQYRYYQEYTYEEIAETTGLPLGTVKAQLFRARELLTEELKNMDGLI
ncbi:MAG: RNA polymerase sigma factor [Bacteroidia bacterium]